MAKPNDIKRLGNQMDRAIIRAAHLDLPLVVYILNMARLELDQVRTGDPEPASIRPLQT